MDSLISIIVPVYNVQAHLEECIKSLLDQSYENMEILLIDDGSKDSSGEICDKFAKICDKIRVFHTENRGVAEARNLGIEKAVGDYLVFVDSDDVLSQSFLEKTHHFITEKNVEYISCSFSKYENGIVGKRVDLFPEEKGLLTLEEYLNRMADFQAGAFWGANWGKMFKAEIIKENNIRFEPNVQFAEDFRFNLEYLKYVNTIYHVHEPLYLYRIDTMESLSKKKRNPERYFSEYYEIFKRYIVLYTKTGNILQNEKKLSVFLLNLTEMVLRNAVRQKECVIGIIKKMVFTIETDEILGQAFKNAVKNRYSYFANRNLYLVGLYLKELKLVLSEKNKMVWGLLWRLKKSFRFAITKK